MRARNKAVGSACIALLLLGTPAQAQVLIGALLGETLSSPTFNLGFEVGANFSTLDGLDGERMNRSVFGLFADWRFSENFHLGGAVLPFAGRGAEEIAPAPTGDPEIDVQTAGGTMTRSFNYVEIPVVLKWAPQREEGIRVGVGPSLGIVTGANDRYDCVSSTGTHYTIERDISDQVPGLDFGISTDVEWRFKQLSIAVRYTNGLTDLSQEGSDAVYSRVLTGTGRIYLGKSDAKR